MNTASPEIDYFVLRAQMFPFRNYNCIQIIPSASEGGGPARKPERGNRLPSKLAPLRGERIRTIEAYLSVGYVTDCCVHDRLVLNDAVVMPDGAGVAAINAAIPALPGEYWSLCPPPLTSRGSCQWGVGFRGAHRESAAVQGLAATQQARHSPSFK